MIHTPIFRPDIELMFEGPKYPRELFERPERGSPAVFFRSFGDRLRMELSDGSFVEAPVIYRRESYFVDEEMLVAADLLNQHLGGLGVRQGLSARLSGGPT